MTTRAALLAGFSLLLSGLPLAAQPVITSIRNAASFEPFACPGALIAIFGGNLAPGEETASAVPWPTVLAGVSVTVNGVPAPLYFVSPGQINAQMPFDVTSNKALVVVRTARGQSGEYALSLLPSAPGIFTVRGDGKGAPVMLSPSFELLDTVTSGQRFTLYATGLGQTDPPAVTGSGGVAAEPFQRVIEVPEVHVGTEPATVEFAGLAPRFPGVYQLNILAPGAVAGNMIQVVSAGRPSQRAEFTLELPDPVIGSDVIISAVRQIADFRRIQLLTVGTVEVQVGAAASLRIEADDNILPVLTTTVRNGTLVLGATRPFRKRESVRFIVSVPALDHIGLLGVGTIIIDRLAQERFALSLSGVGTVRATGAVQSLDLFAQGVGTAALFALSSDNTRVWMSGVGNAQVNARRSLFARVFGLGTVMYTGSPAEIDVDVQGFGSVKPSAIQDAGTQRHAELP